MATKALVSCAFGVWTLDHSYMKGIQPTLPQYACNNNWRRVSVKKSDYNYLKGQN